MIIRNLEGSIGNFDGSGNFTLYYGSSKPIGGPYTDSYSSLGSNIATVIYTIVSPNTSPVVVSISGIPANVNYGTWFNATFVCRDPDGYADISQCRMIVGAGITDSYTCDIIWTSSNTIGNMNDAHSDWQTQTVGTGGATAANSYCTLDIAGSSSSRVGTDVTVVARIMPKPAMLVTAGSSLAGYMYVQDSAGAAAGWTQLGSTGTLRSGPKLIVTTHR
jgi:hypothetical protein